MKSAILLAVGLCLLASGCVYNDQMNEVNREYESRFSYWERIGTWFVDRINDAGDVVQGGVTYGFGAGPLLPLVNVHFTEGIQLGVGWFDGYRMGWEERAFGVWKEKRSEYGFGPLYHLELKRETVAGGFWPLFPFFPDFRMYPSYAFRHDYEYTGLDILEDPEWKEDNHHWADVGFQFHLFVVGAAANVKPAEAVDWLIGWNPIGLLLQFFNYYPLPWDVMQDDTWYQVRDELRAERDLAGE